MNTVQFAETTYAYGVGIAEDNTTHIEHLAMAEQVTLFNVIGSNIGIDRTVKRFADSKTAIRRLTERLEKYAAEFGAEDEASEPVIQEAADPLVEEDKAVAEELAAEIVKQKKANKKAAAKATPAKAKKARRMYMNFVAVGDPKPQCGRDTLRQRIITALTGDGSTFDQLVKITTAWDKHQGRPGRERAEGRTYETLRVIHYYLNMSLNHAHDTTGIIKIVPNKAMVW